jgi:hypothetical protein
MISETQLQRRAQCAEHGKEEEKRQHGGIDGRKADAEMSHASSDPHELHDPCCGVQTRGIADPSKAGRPALLLSRA